MPDKSDIYWLKVNNAELHNYLARLHRIVKLFVYAKNPANFLISTSEVSYSCLGFHISLIPNISNRQGSVL